MRSLRQQDLPDERFIEISKKETIMLVSKSVAVVILLNYCFYRSFWVLVPLGVLGVFFYREEKRDLLYKKKEDARQQFKEMLYLVAAGQRAGYSVENAFLNSYSDLENLYGGESCICRILSEIRTGLENHRPVTDLWKNIGARCNIVEIKEFSEVFAIAKESGGSMTAMLENTAEILGNKAETKKEIYTHLSARRMEQKIMNAMPFALMLYVELASPGYFDGMYHSLEGSAIMTIGLVIYLVAYVLGKKLIAIEI